MDATTRFHCSCGRLLTAESRATVIVCPTCSVRNAVPGAAPPPAASSTATTLSHYRLEGLLGQGGMGSVHRAIDQRNQRPVALKVLHAALRDRPDFVSRFRREARAASELDHPNVVRVLDFGVDGNTSFLVMELLEGPNLLEVRETRPVPEAEILEWMAQTAAGLRAAELRGIVHRDVKPSNLLLVGGDRVKIADFGLAKSSNSESHLTLTGEVLGTPHYMSPEQGQGTAVDVRSDLYSLGASFYHLLGGRPPFQADTPVAVIMKHVREEPEALRSVAPAVSVELESVVHRLLQKRPEDRYASYQDLLRDLQRIRRNKRPKHGALPPRPRVRLGSTTYVLPAAEANELVLRPAGSLRRVFAAVLDLCTLELLYAAIAFAAASTFSTSLEAVRGEWRPLGDGGGPPQSAYAGLVLALALLYQWVSDSTGGRSFGRRTVRLRTCRADGRDLGPARAFLRILSTAPIWVLGSPTLSAVVQPAFVPLLGTDEGLATKMRVAALVWTLALFVPTRLAGTRPLHDLITGASVYRASRVSRSIAPVRSLGRKRRELSARRAFLLSALPGVGLLYAGQWTLGLVAMLLLPALVARNAPPDRLFTIWLASALVAAASASSKRRSAEQSERNPGDPTEPDPGDSTEVLRREN